MEKIRSLKTMSKKKTISEKELTKREDELYRLHYDNEDEIKIEQYQKYHFRVFYKGDCIDVWPVSRKYYAKWFSQSKNYKSVQEIIKAFNSKPKVKVC